MAGISAQWLAWRLKQPAIVLLLLIGIVAGPSVAGLINPDQIFADLLFPVISLGVALVLFEGALTLRFSDLRGHGKSVTSVITWGAAINWVLISLGTLLFVDIGWSMAFLFGALVLVTGPTVILPLLRTVKPNHTVSNILRWEGILIDPIGALLAVLVFEVIIAGGSNNFWLFLAHELASGVFGGILGGLVLTLLLRNHWLPEYLQNVFTLAMVLTVFTLANSFAEESGLLAVTVMGIWLANARGIEMEEILSFKENLSILIISALFIVLAARVDLALIANLGWAAAGIIAVIFIARLIMIFASTIHSNIRWQEKLLLSWIAPRGIVAAAVSALFAFKLEALGYANAALLPAMTFLVIIVTVVLQSLTSATFARLLGVRAEDKGVLIVGGNPVAIAIAQALNKNGFKARIASANWSEIQAARMAGLETYFGNVVSAHADCNLDLLGVGQLFAMSRRPAMNSLAAIKYQPEFGKGHIFTLRNAEEKDFSEKDRLTTKFRVPRLFGEDISAQKMASLISQGYEIKSTKLTDEFGVDEFEKHYGKVLKLFAIDNKGVLKVYTDSYTPNLQNGWSVMFLLPGKKDASAQKPNLPSDVQV